MYSKVIKSNHREDLVDKYNTYRNVLTTILNKIQKKNYLAICLIIMKRTQNKTWSINQKLAKVGQIS